MKTDLAKSISILAVCLFILNTMDAITTYVGIVSGKLVESNELFTEMTHNGEWGLFLLIKMIPTTILLLSVYVLHTQNWINHKVWYMGILLIVANTFYIWVVLNNIINLYVINI